VSHGHRHGHGLGHGHGHGYDEHGNPEDLAPYLRRMTSAARARWQKPEAVLRALALRPGMTVADVGAGPGYFALRMARRVGPRGRVFAAEVEPRILAELARRMGRARNVTPVLAFPDDPLLPQGACDRVLVVNVLHHVKGLAAYFGRLARALAPGGSLAAIDFERRELPVGPPPDLKVSREEFRAAAERAGLRVHAEHRFLPYQYFFIFKARRPRR
jgi:ubiquinone/menaquinone biosynthesis C-methylase UbiE